MFLDTSPPRVQLISYDESGSGFHADNVDDIEVDCMVCIGDENV